MDCYIEFLHSFLREVGTVYDIVNKVTPFARTTRRSTRRYSRERWVCLVGRFSPNLVVDAGLQELTRNLVLLDTLKQIDSL